MVAAVTARAVARAAAVAATDFNMLFVETVCTPSLPCFDKTLGKNHRLCDFFPEFSIV